MFTKRMTYGFAMLIAALAGLGVGVARAQTEADVAAVTTANNAFYVALSALDAAAMEKVWASEAYITNIGPNARAVGIGPSAVQDAFKKNFLNLAQMTVKPVDTQVHINGNTGWAVGRETGEAKLKDGTSRTLTNFVTNIFEKKDGRWLLVSHQAQVVPQ
jgi:ketosteroid isomerase-like protein